MPITASSPFEYIMADRDAGRSRLLLPTGFIWGGWHAVLCCQSLLELVILVDEVCPLLQYVSQHAGFLVLLDLVNCWTDGDILLLGGVCSIRHDVT